LSGLTRTFSRLAGVWLIIALAGLWELSVAVELIDSPTLPGFSQVALAFWKLFEDGTLAEVLGSTLARLAAGYVLASAMGIILGMVMGYFAVVHRLLEPLVEFLRPIPSPAYIPIAILFFGIGDTMKVLVIAFAAFFPVLINTIAGIRTIDPVLRQTGYTLGLSTWQSIVKISVPNAMVSIMTGLRISIAIALIVTVISEMVAGNSGIGFFIISSQQAFRIPELYAAVVALGVVGYCLNAAFVALERRTLRWAGQ
jgi:ABC-type nitrate/sulfonate/bicarbonate transport system permease component